jgi:hypothetical protein
MTLYKEITGLEEKVMGLLLVTYFMKMELKEDSLAAKRVSKVRKLFMVMVKKILILSGKVLSRESDLIRFP